MDTSDQASVSTQASKRPRRMRSSEEKRRIVEESMVPGTSLASVALKHGVNANLLFSWRRLHQRGLLVQCREPAALLPVAAAPSASSHQGQPKKRRAVRPAASVRESSSLEIELASGVTIRVQGPIESATLEAVLSALHAR
jgi:transposase